MRATPPDLASPRRLAGLAGALLLGVWAVAGGAQAPGEGELAKPSDEWHVAPFTGDVRLWVPESKALTEGETGEAMVLYEVTRFPHVLRSSAEQQGAAEELVRRTEEAASRLGWHAFERAVADGYELMFDDTVHYANRRFIGDGAVLDPERPEFLMYYDTEGGKRLAGVMYLVEEPAARGPQVGGPLTVWHYHRWAWERCLLDGLLLVGDPHAGGACREGAPSRRSPEMMHVWLLEHPQGPFATDMYLPPWVEKQLLHGHEHP